MSELKRLLQGVKVEWMPLEKVFDIIAGGDVPRNSFSDIKTDKYRFPILSNGIDEKSLYGWTAFPKICNPSLTISARGTIGWTSIQNKPFFPIVRLLVLTPKSDMHLKYAYHYMKSIEKNYIVSKAGIPQLTKPMIKNVLIPIPCLENPEQSIKIQEEIVRILDALIEENNALTNELDKELQVRQKHYEYYREELFKFEGKEVGWKSLGEVANYSKMRINFSLLNNSNYVGVDNLLQNRGGKTNSNYAPIEGNFTEYDVNSILIGNIRPYLKKIWIADRLGGANGDVLVINVLKSNLLPRFIYEVLSDNKFFNYNMKHAKGAKMPRGDKQKIKEYQIPIPFPSDSQKSIAEQERIVKILDELDTATQTITAEIKKEISLRNKQYEYYRDLLLTFPKVEA